MANIALYILFASLHSQKYAWKWLNPRHTPRFWVKYMPVPSLSLQGGTRGVELSLAVSRLNILRVPKYLFFFKRRRYVTELQNSSSVKMAYHFSLYTFFVSCQSSGSFFTFCRKKTVHIHLLFSFINKIHLAPVKSVCRGNILMLRYFYVKGFEYSIYFLKGKLSEVCDILLKLQKVGSYQFDRYLFIKLVRMVFFV